MPSAHETDVAACEQRLLAAMRASDAAALDALLHDDLLFNGPTGETATKAADLANYRSGGIALHTVEPSDQSIRVIGDDAVVVVTVTIRGSYMGQVVDGRFRYLRVWQRESRGDARGDASGWRVIAGSVTPLAG